MTPRFARDHEHRAVEVLTATDASGTTESNRKLVGDVEAFKLLIAKANRQTKRTNVVAFVTGADIQENMLPGLHLQLTASMFVEVLGCINRRHTSTGFGNMCEGS